MEACDSKVASGCGNMAESLLEVIDLYLNDPSKLRMLFGNGA
jgi:hypothetical protein